MEGKRLTKNKYKTTQRFDQQDVEPLIQRARGSITNVDWVDLLEPKQAEEELVQRFRNLGKNLIRVLQTGKYNYKSSFQVSFLRFFCTKKTPLANVANALKKELESVEPTELESTMDLAIRQAIRDTTSNLATTILIKFHDLIEPMVKGSNKNKECSFEDSKEVKEIEADNEFSSLITQIALSQELTYEEKEIVSKIISGRKVRIPAALRVKLIGILQN